MSELEIVDADEPSRLDQANTVYESLIEMDKAEQESLTVLIEEERKLMALLNDNKRKQRDIEAKRYQRRADIRQAERERDEAKLKEEEALRLRRLEEQKAEAFRDIVAYCHESKFAWLEYAFPHQWEGAMTIAHYGSAILGDDTGLGKTLTAVMSLDMKKAKKVLIVVPNDVVSDFADTIIMYAPHRNLIPIQGATPAIRKMVKTVVETSSEFTVVINYESLWRDFSWLGGIKWDDIMVDEAHNMKNEKGLTFGALDTFKYKNFLAITATSILNEPKDVYTSLHMIAPDQFWDAYQFLANYCMQNADGKWVFRPGGEKALMAGMKGRFIKRSKEEAGINLPEKVIEEVVIEREDIPLEQAEIMSQLSNFAAIQLADGSGIDITAMIALITRERQAATYPAGIEVKVTQKMFDLDPRFPVGHVLFKVPDNIPSVKLDWAEARIEEQVKAGHRTVVFSQFKTALAALEKRLTARGLRVARFDGDTPKHQRIVIKRDFLRPASGESKADYQFDVVLANYKTGGVGLNFTDATYMLCPDEEWNPAKNHQAYSRIHRIGQTEPVLIEVLRIKKSIDMWMKTLNEKKQAIVNGFESEIDMVASLKEFLDIPQKAIETIEQKAIEAPVFDDDDFLTLLDEF